LLDWHEHELRGPDRREADLADEATGRDGVKVGSAFASHTAQSVPRSLRSSRKSESRRTFTNFHSLSLRMQAVATIVPRDSK